jgi:serine/threonine protein kinase
MARIYIGRTTGIGSFERHVVLKLILPERANDATAVQMFLDEARLAASLNHQNVAQVFEVGEDAGIHYLAMEYVHGQDLRALLAKAGSQGTRVPLELALTTVAGAAAGLNHAHERRGGDGVPLGIVHRDVSPSNIMVGYEGSVKLLDFGIAKATARSIETQSGIIKGKFAYMSPEQCRGREVDRRSDVFSLGIILYEISTQHRCFRADSDFDTMHRIVTGDVVRPTRLVQGYPQALEAIVLKALAVDANQRYQSAGLLLEAIESYAMSARMSLSTMALGRFMREMFGEPSEPWLTATGRHTPPPPVSKESTISNTNGSQDAQQQPARTMLDLPTERDDGEFDDPQLAWNAKSYPSTPPSYASPETLPPDEPVARRTPPTDPMRLSQAHRATPDPMRASQPHLATPDPSRTSQAHLAMPSPHPAPPETLPRNSQQQIATPVGSGPLPRISDSVPVPASAFQTPGSSSGQSVSRPSYAAVAGINANDISYPRYEPSPVAPEDVRLKSRMPLVIAIAVLLIGAGVVVVIAFSGNGPDTTIAASPAVAPGSDVTAPATNPVLPPTPAPVAADTKDEHPAPVEAPASDVTPPPAPGDDMISVHVVSDPAGADVLLNAKVIGSTPLDIKMKKGVGTSTLVVHRAHYKDEVSKLDLSGDFQKTVTLRKLVDDKSAHHEPPHRDPPVVHHEPPHETAHVAPPPPPKETVTPTVTAPKVPDCQPPGQMDPFDKRPPCKS